jgi:hypothetical protein
VFLFLCLIRLLFLLYLFYTVFYLPPCCTPIFVYIYIFSLLIHTSIARLLVCVVYCYSPFLLSPLLPVKVEVSIPSHCIIYAVDCVCYLFCVHTSWRWRMLVSAYVSMSLTACPHIRVFSEHPICWWAWDTTRQNHYTFSHLKSVRVILHVGSWVSPPRDLGAHKIFLDVTRHNKNCLVLLYNK